MTSCLSFITVIVAFLLPLCASMQAAVSQTWKDKSNRLVDEMNICCPNTQRWVTFMSVMDD